MFKHLIPHLSGFCSWTLFLLMVLGVILAIKDHGKVNEPKPGHRGNFLVANILHALLLVCGGFFTATGVPQVIMVCFLVYRLWDGVIQEPKPWTTNMNRTLLYGVLEFAMLKVGGFW